MNRLVFVSANQGGGGSEELWVQTALRLRHAGHEILAMTEWGCSAGRRRLQLSKGQVPHESLNSGHGLIGKALDRILRRPRRGVRLLRKRLRMAKADLVILNSGTLIDGIDLLEVIHDEKVPCVVVTHLVSTDNWPDDPLAERIHQAYSRARSASFVSEHNLQLFSRQTGRSLPNAAIVRNPFLVSGEELPMPAISAHQPVKLALPARLHPRTKGQDLLFEVLARPEWRARNLTVTLFGTGGCENSLRALCQELAIGDKVVFAGHVDDMNEVWRSHHALVLPSRHEGLPIAMVEAMISGRAVIATPAGGIPEMIENGHTGFLASACNTESLRAAMEEAWGRRHEWGVMGAQGRKLVQMRIPAEPVTTWADHLLALAAAKCGRP